MNHADEITSTVEGRVRRGTPLVQLLVRTSLAALFLLSSFPLGLLWSIALVALFLIGLPLSIVWIGLPILVLAMVVCVVGANTERWRLAVLLGTRLASPYCRLPGGPVLARLRSRATDPALWRGMLYQLFLLPVGLFEFVVMLVLANSVVLATYPVWYWTFPEKQGVMWTGFFVADTLPEASLVMLVGLVLAVATLAFVLQAARAHAAFGRYLLGPRRRERLDERVEVLTEGRSRAVEAAIVERRRIERDLHDGAQQRLVSLAMALGMARHKLERGSETGNADPQTARATELVSEAHEEAKRALSEIRNLIRGIHPAVLTDRGLDAAISALAGRSPVPTSVRVDLDERPPEAVEITAYFVVTEALANVAKHSGASEAHVTVRREYGAGSGGHGEDLLTVEIQDDGRGGADTSGTGLTGLANRALVLDGRLVVESPTGGPTRVRAELPWGNRDLG